jgi:methionyl-tRNA formyltransferase
MKVVYAGNTVYRLYQWFLNQCQYYGIEHYLISSKDDIKKLENFDYNYGIGYLFPYKIPAIEFSKDRNWLNFHPGPLPEMGGRNLAYQAIREGKDYFGATIHWMNEEFDSGPVIECQRFDILDSYNASDLVRISHDILESFFYKYIPMLFRGEILDVKEEITIKYYFSHLLDDEVHIDTEAQKYIKALYCPPHYPHIIAGGRKYRLVLDE